jgi:hypothetical protein
MGRVTSKNFYNAAMDAPKTLPLDWLRSKHPRCDLHSRCLQAVVYRLSVDPTQLAEGSTNRIVDVENWEKDSDLHDCYRFDFSWSGCSALDSDSLLRFQRTWDSEAITENAAIGVMAMLIWELAQASVVTVRQKGRGGDYDFVQREGFEVMKVEVSGIKTAPHLSSLQVRVAEKSISVVLKFPHEGFVSVTAFDYGQEHLVKSVLKYHRGDLP